jgi:glycosyltransferase involved in cell wall biosynthesis
MPLSIAQVAPLYESVPPKLYGGTERIVSYLTEELVRMGHEVTLFASGDSRTSARLIPGSPRSLRLDPRCRDPLAHHMILLERVLRESPRFDLIHFHCDYIHFPLSRRLPIPTLTTLHGRLDLPDLKPLYREVSEMPLVSISDAQREPLPDACWQATIHHGLPEGFGWRLQSSRREGRREYLAFLGRVSPEKRVDRAIEIARASGMRLKIAAKVDASDRDYFETEIRPLLRTPGVDFLGEIGEADKESFLSGARALLFPIDWPEPFGLVMIEALACGTPVIAFRRGSVPEVIEHGRTGFLVDSVEEAAMAVAHLGGIRRAACRASFERRFTAQRMARDYVAAYEDLVRSRQGFPARADHGPREAIRPSRSSC